MCALAVERESRELPDAEDSRSKKVREDLVELGGLRRVL